MLNALFLALATVAISAQSVLKKTYNLRTEKRGAFVFSTLSVLAAALFFLCLSGFKLNLTAEIIPYALGFALSYGTAVITGFLAIKLGALSLTSLITAYSLIIPTFYGLLFLHEEVSFLFYIGLGTLCVSLFLMNSKKSGAKITLPWVIVVFLAFLGNGACSTVQMVHQKNFSGQYKNEFMIISLFIVAIVMLGVTLFTERGEIVYSVKKGAPHAVLCGVINGVCNLLVMTLAVNMNASIMYPVISAGGILLTGAVSIAFYKERLSKGQYVALALGIISVVLMNI